MLQDKLIPPITLSVNGTSHSIRWPSEAPLLWVLRDGLGLLGTKFGCGVGQCGACTVHVDGNAVRSCLVPVGSLRGREVTTIEGLAGSATGRRLQEMWVEERVSQCGYCQAGMLMSACSLIDQGGPMSPARVGEGLSNFCRCGSYPRVIRAVMRVASEVQ